MCSPFDGLFVITIICQIVCNRRDVFASSLAVARAFPKYSRKTGCEKREATVTTEFVLPDGSLDEEDCVMLDNAAESVRLAARIVDAPCNEMNTDHFLNVHSRLT